MSSFESNNFQHSETNEVWVALAMEGWYLVVLVVLASCLLNVPAIRGALGSAVIAGGVKMKLLAIWFCGNQSMAKGA